MKIKLSLSKDMEFRYIQEVLSMKVNGSIIKLKDRGLCGMPMVTYTGANLTMTLPTVTENTLVTMVPNIKDNLETI